MATLPCVVSDQRWPPAHSLAGKVLPTPEAMALLAGPLGLPVRVTVSWDRVACGVFLVPEAVNWTDDNSLTQGTQLQTLSAFPLIYGLPFSGGRRDGASRQPLTSYIQPHPT